MIKFALMEYASDKRNIFADYSINECVDRLKDFLSITPDDFFQKLEFPSGLRYMIKDAQRWFEASTDNIFEAESLMKNFAENFKELVFQNNHRKPAYYHIIDWFRPGSSDKKLEKLATLRYWNIGREYSV